MLDLKGRTVIEFGPADGVNTGRLIATGARQITAVEGRPENVVKLLAAKYAMGWDNLEILADNFQVPGRWASRHYDAPLPSLAWLPQHSRRPAVIRPATSISLKGNGCTSGIS